MSENLESLITKAEELARAEDYEGALAIASKLIAQHPEEMKVWSLRSYIHARKRDCQTAVEDVSRAIEINSMEPALFFDRGRYHLTLRQFAEAAKDFTRALELCDRHHNDYYRESAHFMRAEAYLKLGRINEARADLKHVRDDFAVWIDLPRSKQAILDECNARGSRS
jgi:tetratricopeptide (TPR) repeat protein